MQSYLARRNTRDQDNMRHRNVLLFKKRYQLFDSIMIMLSLQDCINSGEPYLYDVGRIFYLA